MEYHPLARLTFPKIIREAKLTSFLKDIHHLLTLNSRQPMSSAPSQVLVCDIIYVNFDNIRTEHGSLISEQYLPLKKTGR